MCGFVGLNRNIEKDKLYRALTVMKHRGPDNYNIWVDFITGVSLGHVRLSVIDLDKRANQPFFYTHQGRKIVVVYNGEIYNFLEIKKELQDRGYKFHTSCDTEVLAAAYLEYGEKCVKFFNGMWAFCIFDVQKNEFFCSRDRVGKKPFFYYFDGSLFVFASELWSLLDLLKNFNLSQKIDEDSLLLYLVFNKIPSPFSIYKNIKKLMPGHNLNFNLKTKRIKIYRYYNFPEYLPEYKYLNQYMPRLKNIVLDSIKKRLISDVPIGIFLSGGLDSTSILAFAKKLGLEKPLTFSIGFDSKEVDESSLIYTCVRYYNTHHYHKVFKLEDMEELLEIYPEVYQEPYSSLSGYAFITVSKFLKKTCPEIKVVLSGEGGDEIFSGYSKPWLYWVDTIMQKKIFLAILSVGLSLFPFNSSKIKTLRYLLKKKVEKIYLPNYEKFMEFFKKCEKASEFIRDILFKISTILSQTNSYVETNIRYNWYFGSLRDDATLRLDFATMRYSIEARCPYLDYRLFEEASKIPFYLKVNKKYSKFIQRILVKDYLPPQILSAPKKGFVVPIFHYLQSSKLKDKVKDNIKTSITFLKEYGFYLNDDLISMESNLSNLHTFFTLGLWVKRWGR